MDILGTEFEGHDGKTTTFKDLLHQALNLRRSRDTGQMTRSISKSAATGRLRKLNNRTTFRDLLLGKAANVEVVGPVTDALPRYRDSRRDPPGEFVEG